MMIPAVGRVVHYHGPRLSDQPCCALIVYVWNEHLVNLVVFDRNGNPESHTSVYRGPEEYQWDWMLDQPQRDPGIVQRPLESPIPLDAHEAR